MSIFYRCGEVPIRVTSVTLTRTTTFGEVITTIHHEILSQWLSEFEKKRVTLEASKIGWIDRSPRPPEQVRDRRVLIAPLPRRGC